MPKKSEKEKREKKQKQLKKIEDARKKAAELKGLPEPRVHAIIVCVATLILSREDQPRSWVSAKADC